MGAASEKVQEVWLYYALSDEVTEEWWMHDTEPLCSRQVRIFSLAGIPDHLHDAAMRYQGLGRETELIDLPVFDHMPSAEDIIAAWDLHPKSFGENDPTPVADAMEAWLAAQAG